MPPTSPERVPTGCKALDERIGGIKRGGIFLILGPPLGGKKLFSRNFIVKGLEEGEGCILSSTNSTAEEEHETLKSILGENVEKFIKDGKLIYIDLYSRAIGIQAGEKPYIKRISGMADLASYNVALREVLAKMHGREIGVRLVFDTVSTLLLYNPFPTVSRFLHVLFGRLKALKVTSLFLLEEEAHDKGQVTTLIGMCDGTLTVKLEDNKKTVKYESEGISLEEIEC